MAANRPTKGQPDNMYFILYIISAAMPGTVWLVVRIHLSGSYLDILKVNEMHFCTNSFIPETRTNSLAPSESVKIPNNVHGSLQSSTRHVLWMLLFCELRSYKFRSSKAIEFRNVSFINATSNMLAKIRKHMSEIHSHICADLWSDFDTFLYRCS